MRLVKSDNVMDGALSILKSQKFTDYTLTEKVMFPNNIVK